jgi:hypothetical protein
MKIKTIHGSSLTSSAATFAATPAADLPNQSAGHLSKAAAGPGKAAHPEQQRHAEEHHLHADHQDQAKAGHHKSDKEVSSTARDHSATLLVCPTPIQFGDVRAPHTLPALLTRDAGGDFAARIDAQPLLPGMVHGTHDASHSLLQDLPHDAIRPASAAQLDQWCRQLAGPWPAGEAVRIELPLPGLGPVDLTLEHQATHLQVSVDAGNEAARRWFEQRRRHIEMRLQHYTGKTVQVDLMHMPSPFAP